MKEVTMDTEVDPVLTSQSCPFGSATVATHRHAALDIWGFLGLS
jgi:hypothetical protein